jgi:hypothetical protein
MVRPKHFGFNEQTAISNAFQNKTKKNGISAKAQLEFDHVVSSLRYKDIEVFVFEDRDDIIVPDAIFPNNWITINNDLIVLYPMLTPNRRVERRMDIVDFFKTKHPNFKIIDLTNFEDENKFCEGTGSIVFDHKNKIAYASLSPRTNKDVVHVLCSHLNYEPVIFTTLDNSGNAVYHTNVMLCIGDTFAIICQEAILEKDRINVINTLGNTGHLIVEITKEQMNCFAGNMLQLQNKKGQKFIVMSETSHKSLSLAQLKELEQHSEVLVFSVGTIEFTGGGSIRCMLAEVFS